jgi:hypothetical protein
MAQGVDRIRHAVDVNREVGSEQVESSGATSESWALRSVNFIAR